MDEGTGEAMANNNNNELGKALDAAWVALDRAKEQRGEALRSWQKLTARKSPKADAQWAAYQSAVKAESDAAKVYDAARDAYEAAKTQDTDRNPPRDKTYNVTVTVDYLDNGHKATDSRTFIILAMDDEDAAAIAYDAAAKSAPAGSTVRVGAVERAAPAEALDAIKTRRDELYAAWQTADAALQKAYRKRQAYAGTLFTKYPERYAEAAKALEAAASAELAARKTYNAANRAYQDAKAAKWEAAEVEALALLTGKTRDEDDGDAGPDEQDDPYDSPTDRQWK